MESIPFLSLTFQHNQVRSEVEKAFQNVVNNSLFILGDRVLAFEHEYAEYSGVKYCLGVGNGLDALTIALKSLKLNEHDEVIVPAHTHIATWLAVSKTKARLVPVDADPKTYNINTQILEDSITVRSKGIVPVHLYGQACDMTTIEMQARKHKLWIVEDNAQGQGSTWLQRKTGSFGIINGTSFYPTKNLGALGDGGAITTNEREFFEFARRSRNYGLESKYECVDQGLNSRLDEIQAAVLSVKLPFLDQWNLMRRTIANQYLEGLKNVGDLKLPLSDKEAFHVYHLFVIRTKQRDKLEAFLNQNGIGTAIHYPIPPHLQPAFESAGFRKGSFPVAEEIAETALSLPVWPGLTEGQVGYIIQTIKRFF